MQELFDTVREACSAAVWSSGVELVRQEAVSGEREDDGEVGLRVATHGGMVSPSVTLYVDDAEWECSCAGRDDPCEHVAAAVIALRRARKSGQALPTPTRSAGRIRYRFESEPGGKLAFTREIVSGDAVHPLTTTLDAIASGRVEGPGFSASEADVNVELALGSRRSGVIPREAMPRLLDALSGCDDVSLDGEPVTASRERIYPIAVVEDAPGGFRLRAIKDPAITRRFTNGTVLCGDTLRAVGESRLTGREVHDLVDAPEGRFYAFDRAADLASEVLPGLRDRIPVEVRTARLSAKPVRMPPRVAVSVEREGDALTLLALLVYGDPPVARVDAGNLVHLGGALPVRDEAGEARVLAQVRSELGLVPGHRAVLHGEEALEAAERLERWPGGVNGNAHAEFYRAPAVSPKLDLAGDGFDLSFVSPPSLQAEDAAGGGERSRSASAETVLRAWREGESLVPLLGGGFAPLPEAWLREHGHRIADLLAARDENGAVAKSCIPELAALCEALDAPPPPSFAGLAPLLEGFESIPPAELPADLHGALRPYQQRGVDWLCFLRDAGLGALLADDMGLGKTLQTLCALDGRALVVAPTSVLHSWRDEIARFRPQLRVCVYHGAGRVLDPDADITLTSYAILRLDANVLAAESWEQVVLDEAQAIKNPQSQVAQAAYRLRARARIALTGTPVENRLEELWSQLHFLARGLLGGRRDFDERYARPIAVGDAAGAERLRARIRPFVLRRLKREVAPELPPRTEVVLHCVLADEERRVYDTIHAATQRDIVSKLTAGGNVLAALEALLRLRQAACHPGLVPGHDAESSSKLELLLERLGQAAEDGHRSLVFSQWTALLDRIEPQLQQNELAFERLDGSTRDRAGVVRRFQDETGPPVMLVSLKAGGTGLTLTAADHVFLLDPWWNPAVEDQAADRAHRIGQQRPVVIHRLVAENTVEERILALQERKREIANVALGEADQAASLSREELAELLA